MSKDEFLKIQTCVLKVNIHCDGCKHKVKKILQKIEGVYTTKIDSEQGKVTVSGNIDANTLIKKLIKNGKHAELWGAKPNNNNPHNNLNQFKNLQISNGGKGGGGGGGGGSNNKGQPQKGGGGNHQQKGGAPQGQNPQLQQIQQQMKGLQDMKMLPQFMKDMKLPPKDQNAKSVKFKLPEDEDLSDDDFDDDDYEDDEFDDDDLDDEMDHPPPNKMKPMMGNGHGGPHMSNMMMQNIMNGQLPPHMKPGGNGGGGGGGGGGNSGGNGKKGGGGNGGGNIPVQIGGGGSGGKKGGNGNNGSGNPNQGGGKGGKNGGGGQNGQNGGGQNKNGGGGGGGPANGNHFMPKKMNEGPHGMANMMAMNGGGNMGMGQMGQHMPMGQMNNLAAVQGLPASSMGGGGGPGYSGGPGYGGGAGAEHMQGNPYYQQQLAAMMMNQQRANGNERFQPMMYARPPPAVNYMPPYPPYPYPPPPGERADQYAMFSDENTSSCSLM